MTCGCRKKNQGAAPAAQRTPVVRKKATRVRGEQNLVVPQSTFYSPTQYWVFPAGSDVDDPAAEPFNTLAEAQKHQRDLGPGYSIAAQRV